MTRKKTRDWLVAYHKQGDNDLTRFLTNAKKMQEIYDLSHPEYAAAVQIMANAVISVQDLWQRFRKEKM
jgi:hypothetical protein